MARHHNINGNIVPFTAEEEAARDAEEAAWSAGAFDRAMADLRQRRNKLLQESDWTVLSDNTLTNVQRTSWMNYRTELRNITEGLSTIEDVNSVVFPNTPNG
jgi:hypothetical protein